MHEKGLLLPRGSDRQRDHSAELRQPPVWRSEAGSGHDPWPAAAPRTVSPTCSALCAWKATEHRRLLTPSHKGVNLFGLSRAIISRGHHRIALYTLLASTEADSLLPTPGCLSTCEWLTQSSLHSAFMGRSSRTTGTLRAKAAQGMTRLVSGPARWLHTADRGR